MINRYVAIPATTGVKVTTPDTNGLDLTGTFTVIARVQLNSVTAAAERTIAGKWDTTIGRAFRFSVATDGRLQVTRYTSAPTGGDSLGSHTYNSTGLPIPPWLSGPIFVRARFVMTSSIAITWGYSTDGSVWTDYGTTVAAGNTANAATTTPLELGSYQDGGFGSFDGKIFEVTLLDATGVTVASFDANDAPTGATTITSVSTGEVYTVTGATVAGVPELDAAIPLNYYAVEEALVAFLTASVPVANVFAVTRLLHIPSLFERIQASPTPEQLAAAPSTKHGAIFLFFSGLDSVNVQPRTVDCETSEQEWHIFIFTRYHQQDFTKSIARKINGMLTARVIRALKDFDWLNYYYVSQGLPANSGASSKLRRVTADKLLVAETRAIEDPTLAETLLAYRANLSSNWKGVSS